MKAVAGCEDRIIVENPDLCWFGMNGSPALLTVHLQCVKLGFMPEFVLEVSDCFDSK